ncbi:hypothetical protein GCM10011487_19660 [Steroidobacter agaridevorans]|uniref:Uncharacterized protein n=1 Tax=Steroidobacter agaridevorans TaxID=2695856 RepID=A0A829YBA9_9GAMM|nr:hypothetical protein [Steroidobacter agaridevorans]GFE79966.1 hypothetical protein GCM10011487_19660 [Steroidobacter agaridevorans]
MNGTRDLIRSVLFLAACVASATAAASSTESYQLKAAPNNAVTVERAGKRAVYQPVFTVIKATSDPKLRLSGFASTPGESLEGVNVENYPLPRWRAASGEGNTDIVYEAGAVTEIRATSSRALDNGGTAWTFAANPDFTLEAEVRPVPGEAPRISWKFTARTPGWYTVGYTGAPASNPAGDDGFLQPLIWQEKRFPRAPLMTAESMGGLPLTLVTRDGVTRGLSVDPAESPYRLPTIANARFGVMLRNPKGEAQPTAFAPLLGQTDSHFDAGQSATFSVRPLLVSGDWYQAFTEAARSLFGFNDYRQNFEQSLNATIDTMTEFAMDDVHAGWDADLRGFDYNTDVKGTVKVVSALHPLATSLIQDDPEVYRLRALPITEFLMSRTKYLYNTLPDSHGQNAARDMKGPAAEVSELAELYQMSHGQSPVFRHYALELAGKPRQLNLLMVSDGATFWDKLALYRLTGDKTHLNAARSIADKYIKARINTPQRDFSDVRLETGGQFWSDFAPKFVELFELWQETKEPRYLAAAQAGARTYASYAWYYPRVPGGEITVDRGGAAPVGYFMAGPDSPGIPTPEITLPAWQVSQVGLTPEAQTTYHLNPATFLAHHAAYELRIAAAANDSFLHDAARSAIVGRYKSFPGYDINVTFSNVYARSDYLQRPFSNLTYNEVYFNHVWPHIALLTDYLMSDFETRSKGAIEFPARYAQGYAYLRSKVYGDRPGKFMGDDNVRLWMPRRLITSSDPQANYLTGYGNDRFYLALSNESPDARKVTVTLDRERVPYEPGREYSARVWVDGKPAGTTTVVNGSVTLPLSPKGLTAIAVDGLPVFTRLHTDYFNAQQAAPSDKGFRTDQTPVGNATAMFLSFAGRHDFYLWTGASDSDVKSARVTLKNGKSERTLVDQRHPFEFSTPAGDAKAMEYHLEFVRTDGTVVDGGRHSIER